ncbi:hypothetical protein RIF23_03930 [Lipingzhangella sp. LS1_29]|uniref:Uncharacterized protein n=1 Tax=Lipingzhangella rawalii TaxID=2055835 RepID=A0ABU2H2B2_9ACTN|nr:hypothetical protein [Lipingzhangella rawalii]MDS1269442.1 hypothetical protein [Lipingzhangella rawalii]
MQAERPGRFGLVLGMLTALVVLLLLGGVPSLLGMVSVPPVRLALGFALGVGASIAALGTLIASRTPQALPPWHVDRARLRQARRVVRRGTGSTDPRTAELSVLLAEQTLRGRPWHLLVIGLTGIGLSATGAGLLLTAEVRGTVWHILGVATAAGVLLVLLAGVVVGVWIPRRARQARARCRSALEAQQ